MNRSFEVRAGARRWFLKLASDPSIRAGLGRWHRWGERLETRYRAPRALAWVDVEGTPFAGILFEWIEGSPPRRAGRDLFVRVATVLARLHDDETLRRDLSVAFDPSRTCAALFRDTLHERFVEDLKGIAAQPPPFVDEDRLRLLGDQAAELDRLVSSCRAFDEPADAPTHGDPWLDNLIVTADSSVRVVDWDDLGLGDPVLDWAILLGPGRRDRRVAIERSDLIPRALSGAELTRLRVWSRATALDWVIDPLADWVDADPATPHGRALKRVNRRVHEAALARYVKRYLT